MKKYKLKIDLGGKKAGYIVELSGSYTVSWYDSNSVEYKTRVDNTSVWEEVKELPYEVLSFIVIDGNGSFAKEGEIIKPNSNRESWIATSRATYTYDYLVEKTGMYAVHSVKRISDGVVFTLGDLVLPNGESNSSISKIKELRIANGSIYVSPEVLMWGQYLPGIKHAPKPIFTSEEGLSIYDDDTYYYVDPTKLEQKVQRRTAFTGVIPIKHFLRFKSKELAEAKLSDLLGSQLVDVKLTQKQFDKLKSMLS